MTPQERIFDVRVGPAGERGPSFMTRSRCRCLSGGDWHLKLETQRLVTDLGLDDALASFRHVHMPHIILYLTLEYSVPFSRSKFVRCIVQSRQGVPPPVFEWTKRVSLVFAAVISTQTISHRRNCRLKIKPKSIMIDHESRIANQDCAIVGSNSL